LHEINFHHCIFICRSGFICKKHLSPSSLVLSKQIPLRRPESKKNDHRKKWDWTSFFSRIYLIWSAIKNHLFLKYNSYQKIKGEKLKKVLNFHGQYGKISIKPPDRRARKSLRYFLHKTNFYWRKMASETMAYVFSSSPLIFKL
jgi:hypothetical protein